MGYHVIAAYILIQAEAGKAAMVTAALRDVPGVSEMASLAGPCDVIARAQARDIGELAGVVAARVPGAGGVTPAMSCPAVHLQETDRRGPPHHHPRGDRGRRADGLLIRLAQPGVRRGQDGAGTMGPLQRAADAGQ